MFSLKNNPYNHVFALNKIVFQTNKPNKLNNPKASRSNAELNNPKASRSIAERLTIFSLALKNK